MSPSVTVAPLLLRLVLLLTAPQVLLLIPVAPSGAAVAVTDRTAPGPLAGPLAGPPAAPGTDLVGTWPLRPQPMVVHAFDPPVTTWGAGHRGVDLLATPGQGVLAALPGTVAYAGTLAGRGVLVVAHGSTRTTYEPVAATVEVGTVVAAGDRLGTVQAGPSHCAPRTCLHWGWIAGETYLDPLRLVGAGPVRLLPLLAAAPVGAARPTVRLPPGGPPVPAWW